MDREYQPISAWGYIGYRILFAIPVVGLICTIVFAIGAHNRNLKNLARSQIIVYIIVIILAVIASLMGWSPT